MKTISRKPRTRLARKLFWVIACLAWNAAIAQNDTLKDNRGRAIEVRIISATETHVVCIKASDKKEVTIALDTLDAESQKKITGWRMETGRLPKKNFSLTVASTTDQSKKYLVNFKLPEGNYNSAPVQYNTLKLKFDGLSAESSSGEFIIQVMPIDKNKNEAIAEILRDVNAHLERMLGRMSPTERTAKEPSMKIHEVSHGDFMGYGLQVGSNATFTRINTTNGKFTVLAGVYELSSDRTDKALVEPEDIMKILGTLEIEKSP
jgi:hypothetical protein